MSHPARFAACAAADAGAAASTRVTRPVTISFAASFRLPAPGVDVSYPLSDRLALGAQATSMILYSELTLMTVVPST
jgi:hypothetical protein